MAEEDKFEDGSSNGIKSTIIISSKLRSNKAGYLTLNARVAFTQLRYAFIEALILYHFNLKLYIRIETNATSYTISRVLSQLTSNDLGRRHLIAYFLHKMISAKTR